MCDRIDQQQRNPQHVLHQFHRGQLQDQLDEQNGEPVELPLLLDQLVDDRDGQPTERFLLPDQLFQLDERDGDPVEGLLLQPPDQLELQQLGLDQHATGSAGQLGTSGL